MSQTGRTQEMRRAESMRALLAAARQCFAEHGYTGTGTPEIVAAAGLTRGALYHYFADKTALFAAVVEEEQTLLAMAINAAAGRDHDESGPVKALIEGGDAFLTAMQDSGRRQILLIDAPSVLGRGQLDAIASRHGLRLLVERVEAAIKAEAIRDLPVLPLARLLDALFERAALADPAELPVYRKAIKALIRGLKI